MHWKKNVYKISTLSTAYKINTLRNEKNYLWFWNCPLSWFLKGSSKNQKVQNQIQNQKCFQIWLKPFLLQWRTNFLEPYRLKRVVYWTFRNGSRKFEEPKRFFIELKSSVFHFWNYFWFCIHFESFLVLGEPLGVLLRSTLEPIF